MLCRMNYRSVDIHFITLASISKVRFMSSQNDLSCTSFLRNVSNPVNFVTVEIVRDVRFGDQEV